MKVGVVGLWHLGTVTAGCLAAAGHDVIGIDDDAALIKDLSTSVLPVQEPGLTEMYQQAIGVRKLSFTIDAALLGNCDVVWITYDTPVNEQDQADTEYVVRQVVKLLGSVSADTLIIVSSQLPVGSIARLERAAKDMAKPVRFACLPENLRLGKAIEVFTKPDRVVAGVRNDRDKAQIKALLEPFDPTIEWMVVESAEMTKHAINAYLATSIAFINEIAVMCQRVGADAMEVERGLKTDIRIGPRAYLHAGNAFSGGTLARDVGFLRELGVFHDVRLELLNAVRASNTHHATWLQREVVLAAGDLKGKRACVLGLTYKPGTNTLRRSSAVETCLWLSAGGAQVNAYDPAITSLPEELGAIIRLSGSVEDALADADVTIVATEWPVFREVDADTVVRHMRSAVIIDPARFSNGRWVTTHDCVISR